MVDLCQFSFDKGFRAPGNPAITSICQVACPSQLVQATGLQRSDEKNSNFVCNNNFEKPGGVITRTMNCGKYVLCVCMCPIIVAYFFMFFF